MSWRWWSTPAVQIFRTHDELSDQNDGLCLVTNVRKAQYKELVRFVPCQSHEELCILQFWTANQNCDFLSSSQTSSEISWILQQLHRRNLPWFCAVTWGCLRLRVKKMKTLPYSDSSAKWPKRAWSDSSIGAFMWLCWQMELYEISFLSKLSEAEIRKARWMI